MNGVFLTSILYSVIGSVLSRVLQNTLLKNEPVGSTKTLLVLVSTLAINFLLPKSLSKYRTITESLFATFLLDFIVANYSENNTIASNLKPFGLNIAELYVGERSLYIANTAEIANSVITLEAETENLFRSISEQGNTNVIKNKLLI